MKILAIVSTLLVVILAVALGITYHTVESGDTQQSQELETMQSQLDAASRETTALRARGRELQGELDQTRSQLAEAKTLENSLRLQLAELERKARLMRDEQARAQQTQETLQAELRQVKTELVQLHTRGSDSTAALNEARLQQYEKEIEELQQALRLLQATRR